ncbi:SDR family NAD(P)-dependent oxidoreductase [Providencia burhodogranariea]|uniref:Short-chain dehydrogenase/reductase SDR n=1 Tax=Providencia burhodogranariea DSM 19968 TaxID=1141662 RepID=K8WTG6_9GAMM|nr:SDR family NAD(P)-dependent oxidoreductase [Providencia burhodogranariea]EKT60737.1 short-chain dehydrogenase/reductase SDR [Providencia burhodogranariea DSM 19968]
MTNPIALVTGGTSGIGKATAKLLAAKGAIVTISGRRVAEGAQVVGEIVAAGGQAQFIRCDVSDEDAVRGLIESVVAKYGRIDWLAHCAAVSLETKLLVDSDTEIFKSMVDINLLGTYYTLKYTLRQMQQQAGGAIVNISSIAGLKGSPLFAPYAATKFGVVGMTKSAALEYAGQNIRINAVAPGGVRTELLEGLFAMGQFDETAVAAMHPLKRIGEPLEIANGIAWLLSDESSFVTGHVLSIDGGLQAL